MKLVRGDDGDEVKVVGVRLNVRRPKLVDRNRGDLLEGAAEGSHGFKKLRDEAAGYQVSCLLMKHTDIRLVWTSWLIQTKLEKQLLLLQGEASSTHP